MDIKKLLGKAGAKSKTNLSPLALSPSLCNALSILSQIFGQTWHLPVVGELNSLLSRSNPPSGQTLALILQKLVEEASIARPGLSRRFLIHPNQFVYRSADRRYVVLILQGEGQTVRVVWQVSVRQAGTSYISYVVDGTEWTPIDWQVAKPCLDNLELLAKVGGEVLGFLEEHRLLPNGSPFQKALDAQIAYSSVMKESATTESKISAPQPADVSPKTETH